jgi:hypothetical protein
MSHSIKEFKLEKARSRLFELITKLPEDDIMEFVEDLGSKLNFKVDKSEIIEGFEVREYKCTIHMLDGNTITGKVNICALNRLSEVFTKDPSPFVVIYDATEGDGSRKKTFFLSKSAIAWVEPEGIQK